MKYSEFSSFAAEYLELTYNTRSWNIVMVDKIQTGPGKWDTKKYYRLFVKDSVTNKILAYSDTVEGYQVNSWYANKYAKFIVSLKPFEKELLWDEKSKYGSAIHYLKELNNA